MEAMGLSNHDIDKHAGHNKDAQRKSYDRTVSRKAAMALAGCDPKQPHLYDPARFQPPLAP